jgi:hypothetical protein
MIWETAPAKQLSSSIRSDQPQPGHTSTKVLPGDAVSANNNTALMRCSDAISTDQLILWKGLVHAACHQHQVKSQHVMLHTLLSLMIHTIQWLMYHQFKAALQHYIAQTAPQKAACTMNIAAKCNPHYPTHATLSLHRC